ncbi:hypothetical protein V6N13_008759 [Hibiscus sabdariffa]|uniref:Uncharacterized protein n=1 Tax=Hibiscus sabdariffa TaxID=183260 RepID=A0ABR2EDA3_9ROSI
MVQLGSLNSGGSVLSSEEKDDAFIEPCFGNDHVVVTNADNESGRRLGEMDRLGNNDSMGSQQAKLYQKKCTSGGSDFPVDERVLEKEKLKHNLDKSQASLVDMGQCTLIDIVKEIGKSD